MVVCVPVTMSTIIFWATLAHVMFLAIVYGIRFVRVGAKTPQRSAGMVDTNIDECVKLNRVFEDGNAFDTGLR